ncbi:hypothetical protein acdb102_31290 [Acidothermaceae bacterium B102]|nr:hypothetical protein acdb102_31290 [Acidothermaceae bacterium B102]
MTFATTVVEVAFGDNPLGGSYAWVDITDYVSAFDTKRGRNYELDSFQAGTATFILDNSDGRFTPGLAIGAYYPNILPRRRIRVRSIDPVTSTTYIVFTGFVESWQQTFPGGGPQASQVVCTAVDGFKQLGQAQLRDFYYTTIKASSAGPPKLYLPLNDPAGSTSALEGSTPAAFSVPIGHAVADNGSVNQYTFGNAALNSHGGTSLNLGDSGSKVGTGPFVQVYLDTAGGYQPSTAAGAVEMWFQVPASSGGSATYLLATDSRGPANGIGLAVWIDGLFTGQLAVATGGVTLTFATPDLRDGKPHYFAYVWGIGGAASVYLDGVSVYSVSSGANNFSAYDCFAVGNSPSSLFRGSTLVVAARLGITIADLAFYNTLTATDVAQHYAAGVNGTTGEAEATRMGRVLDAVGWTGSSRVLDTSVSMGLSPAVWQDGDNALNLVQGFATDAGGYVFINGNGQLVYHNRQHRSDPVSAVTYQETGGMGVEGDIAFHSDDSLIKNDVSVLTPAAGTARVRDTTSQAYYGLASDSLTLNIISSNEALDAANTLLANYKDAKVRCDQISLEPTTSDLLWASVLRLEIGNCVTVAGLPANAPSNSIGFVVESVAHSVKTNGQTPEWTTVFQLSPVPPYTGLRLDDAVFGLIDQNALVY